MLFWFRRYERCDAMPAPIGVHLELIHSLALGFFARVLCFRLYQTRATIRRLVV